MAIDELEREHETARLSDTLQLIATESAAREEMTTHLKSGYRTVQSSFWDNISHDPSDFDAGVEMAQELEELNRQKRDYQVSYQILQKLLRMAQAPYFARIDFREQERPETEEIYIGIGSLYEPEHGNYLVYDWRTPIAGMYYDYGMGAAEYHCPNGVIAGEITLKRQYKIISGQLEYMFNSDLKIDDEMLQELLGRNTDEKMRSIVQSIQREQNQIIRNTEHRLLIVQGAAGSGKTSIALHRAAYLLYKHRESLRARNILILSPNRIFSDYIINVLPELGEENVGQTTFQEYAAKLLEQELQIEDRNFQMEKILTGGDPEGVLLTNLRYKASADFQQVLLNYLNYLTINEASFHEVVFGGKVVFTKAEWAEFYQVEGAGTPLSRRMQRIRGRILYLLEPLEKGILKEVIQELIDSGAYHDFKEVKARARMRVREELRELKEKIYQWTSLNVLELYRNLFRDLEFYRKFAEGTALPARFETIQAATLEKLEQGVIGSEDLVALLYLKSQVDGLPAASSIRHLIIDEAQDYSLLHYELIKQLFPESTLTILGDLRQAIYPSNDLKNFEALFEVFGKEHAVMLSLSKSYRATQELLKFSTALLPGEVKLEAVSRVGNKPLLVEVVSGKMAEAIAEELRVKKAAGLNSIAIICKTAVESERVFQALLALQVNLTLIVNEEVMLSHGIVVLPIYLAKGLEFDAVLVVDVSAGNFQSEWERALLYTATTRALHQLSLFYQKELSPFLQTVAPEFYEKKSF